MDEDLRVTDEQEAADNAEPEAQGDNADTTDGEGLHPAGDAPNKAEAVSASEKALRDTKVWATKLAQENAELKRIVADFNKQSEAQTASEIDALRESVYADYPELKGLLEPLIQDISEIKRSKANDAEKSKHQEALDYFNSNVKPEVLKAHPDFDSILFDGKGGANDEYFTWALKQRPSLRIAAMDSSDPEDITWAVTEFKKYKGSGEAQALKQKQENERRQKLVNSQTLRGGKSTIPIGPTEKASDDNKPIQDWIADRNKQIYGR